MATITAAAGGGNWTTGATWVGGVAPTAADDAVLAVTSGAVTVNSGAVCRSLDANAYTNTLTHSAAVTLTIGDGTAGASSRALRLGASMTYTLGSATTSIINFISTSATVQTITTAGKVMPSWTINGVGSSYQLADNNTATGADVTLTSGTLNVNGKTCSWGSFNISGSTTRTITLGASAITLTGTAPFTSTTTTNLTITAHTTTLTITAADPTLALGAVDHSGLGLVFTGGGTLVIALTGTAFVSNTQYTGTATKTCGIRLSGANAYLAVVGTLTITGNSAVNRVLVSTDTPGTARVFDCIAVSLTNVDFKDITANTTAFTGTSIGDCLGNTNVTGTTPTTQTHTASAGGNWSDASKWTSRVPLPQDTVVVDANTTGTITVDMPRIGAGVSFSGFTGTAAFNSVANEMYGNLTLGSGMTISGTQTLTLAARSSKTITSNGKQLTQALNIWNPSGTYTLVDALSTALALDLEFGTFTTAGFGVTATTVTMSNSPTVTLSTSTVNLEGTSGTVWTGQGTLSAASSTIVVHATSTSSRTFAGGGKTYGTLTYTLAGSTGALVISGANTFGTINFSDASNARTITFPASTTTTISTLFNVNGTSGKLMSITSSSPGTKATLSKASGVVSCDYLSITDSIATGGASWLAGANSVDN